MELDIQTVNTSCTGRALLDSHLEGLIGEGLFGVGLVKVVKDYPFKVGQGTWRDVTDEGPLVQRVNNAIEWILMLFASREVRIRKSCARGLEYRQRS